MHAGDLHQIGCTEVEVSALSMGTAPLGNLYTAVSDDEATATVDAARAAGVRYFDTAPLYGFGLAEQRIGHALAARDGCTLSTKVGRLLRHSDNADRDVFDVNPTLQPVFDYTAVGVQRSLEESLERLGLDRVDIALIHDPDDHVEQALSEAYPALHDLRAQGVIGAIGVGMNVSDIPTRFVQETDIDCVLLAGRYTLLDQTGLADLLPAAADRGVSIIAAAIYNSGILTDPRPGARFNYVEAAPAVLAKAQRLDAVCRQYDVPLKAAALQYPLRHPAVASVLTGMRSPAEVAENAALIEHSIPDALWKELAAEGLAP